MIVVGARTVTCPACHGARVIGEPGLTFPGRTCTACSGSGRIRQAEHTTEEPTS